MRVLFILTALVLFSGCSENQELTGPWEMWVLVSAPTVDDVWRCESPVGRAVRWAAVPGETVRCELLRDGEHVMELFDWQSSESGFFNVGTDLTEAGKGTGYQVVVIDDQGFYGVSEEFTIL